jgi:hypothetical protein
VAEWSIAPVLKTGNGQPFVSSNLTASANETRGVNSSGHSGAQPAVRVVAFLSSVTAHRIATPP